MKGEVMEFIKKQPQIFILSGKAGSGKNQVADFLSSKKSIQISYAYYLKMYAKNILSWDGQDPKPRSFLQEFGVSLIKEKIASDFLIRRILEDIEVYSYFYDRILITDARFQEEIEEIKKHYPNALSIRIQRTKPHPYLTEEQQRHCTETSLDHYQAYDYILENKGDLNLLKKEVESILKEVEQ